MQLNRRELIERIALILGGTLSVTLSRALLADTDSRRSPRTPFFDAEARAMITVIAELIIPRTETPGAIDAGVPAFIEMMVGEWYTATERRIFRDGLAALTRHCQEQHGATFLDCNAGRQTAALQHAEQQAATYQGPPQSPLSTVIDEHTPFFSKIRELTVVGYYTSEPGARQEHSYNPMPMRYNGDLALADVGRQWSS